MENRDEFNNAGQATPSGAAGFFAAAKMVAMGIFNFIRWIGSYVFRMRKLIMSVPVVLAAVWLGQYNAGHLPEQVGLNLQANGEYAYMVSRNLAVLCPLGVTAFCLVMVFLSRRTVYPWIISIFSLALPILLLVTNTFLG